MTCMSGDGAVHESQTSRYHCIMCCEHAVFDNVPHLTCVVSTTAHVSHMRQEGREKDIVHFVASKLPPRQYPLHLQRLMLTYEFMKSAVGSHFLNVLHTMSDAIFYRAPLILCPYSNCAQSITRFESIFIYHCFFWGLAPSDCSYNTAKIGEQV